MTSLAELQRAVREGVLGQPSATLLAELVSDRICARQRFDVYRNHFRVSLKEGLAALFPATRLLLGERCFDATAGLFVAAHPPRDPRLSIYGGRFPHFLSRQAALQQVLYASDVARLEWELSAVAAAPARPARPFSDYDRALRQFGGGFSLLLAPAAVLFASDWQVQAIRRHALAGDAVAHIEPLVRSPTPVRLLLHRDRDGDACELPLDAAGYTALREIRAGASVAAASAAAIAVDPGYPVPALLAFVFETRLVIGIDSTPVSATDTRKGVAP